MQGKCGKVIVHVLLSVDSYYTMVQYNSTFGFWACVRLMLNGVVNNLHNV